jgi:hypothetical protein
VFCKSFFHHFQFPSDYFQASPRLLISSSPPRFSQLLPFLFTNTTMGSHASDDKIYLLGRDEAETERYVSSLRVLISTHHTTPHPSFPLDLTPFTGLIPLFTLLNMPMLSCNFPSSPTVSLLLPLHPVTGSDSVPARSPPVTGKSLGSGF